MEHHVLLDEATTAATGLGLVLGLRHALEADHLVAMSNLVTSERRPGRGVAVGLTWAAGHTAILALVSGLVLGLEWTMGARLTAGFELLVAVSIVFLGARLLVSTWRGGRLHSHPHSHGPRSHSHLHIHAGGLAHDHDDPVSRGRPPRSLMLLPLLVGMVHGLAGSGALIVLLAATRPSLAETLAFVVVFGIGSAAGMVGMSVLIAVPARWSARRANLDGRPIQTALAVVSMAFGVWLAASVMLTTPG